MRITAMPACHIPFNNIRLSVFGILIGFCLILTPSSFGYGFNPETNQETLSPNHSITFTLAPEEEKSFVIKLKESDFAEISWLVNDGLNLSFALNDPSGRDLVEDILDVDDSIPFIAGKSGDYILKIKLNKSEGVTESQKITLQYSNQLKLPTKNVQTNVIKINGYDVKILKSPEEEKSYLIIEKDKRLKSFMKAYGGTITGFNFFPDFADAESAEEKSMALLVRNTPDKTGDGISDVAIQYYSGGAHCCFSLLFFELGETVKPLPILSTGNSSVHVIGRNPKGGLLFETYDDIFAYWLTSYADSPMPTVILEFQKGALRPNFNLMRKPAPSLTKLRQMARAKGAKIGLEPYKGVDDPSAGFEVVFWDVMLDLIYTGHEELAWQYLDLVWPVKKQGKAIFLSDFKDQLSNSQFWSKRF
jgi:hypothetical protein